MLMGGGRVRHHHMMMWQRGLPVRLRGAGGDIDPGQPHDGAARQFAGQAAAFNQQLAP